jgi:alcohol dehydrogenase (NADP+)
MNLSMPRVYSRTGVQRLSTLREGSRNISPLFLGTYQVKPEQVPSAIKSAIQLGYRSFDCAPIYFNETQIGDAFAMVFSEGLVCRQDVFIGSKLASPFHRKEHVKIGLQKSLTDLRLDYLDQFIIHWPQAFDYIDIDPMQRGYDNEEIGDSGGGTRIDPTVSVHETWEGMEDLVDEGLVRSIGVSNFTASLLHELMTTCRIPPAVNQVEAHPYLQQTKLLKYCKKRGVHLQAYSPLGSPGHTQTEEPQILQDPVLKRIAEAHSVTVAQVCISWALQRGTSIVVKSVSPERQRENLLLDPHGELSAEQLNDIESLEKGYRFFRPEEWWDKMAVFD